MKTNFLTLENLAYLGVLDDFYSLYDSLIDLYRGAWEEYQDSIPNEFLRASQIKNKLLNPQVTELMNQFLRSCGYLFINTGAHIYLNHSGREILQMFEYKHKAPLKISISCVTFEGFLAMMENMIISILLQRARYHSPKTPRDVVAKQVEEHFCALAEAELKQITISAAEDPKISSEVIVFKSLSSISCNLKGHEIGNEVIFVELLHSKNLLRLPVHRCHTCGRVFIGNETLKLYEKKFGKMLISTRKDMTSSGAMELYSSESPLHKLGYNVVAGRFSEEERHVLLVKIYESKRLSLFEIRRDLENAIRIFEYRSQYTGAVSRWKEDLYFISEYAKLNPI